MTDAELIDLHGGAAKLAERLGYAKDAGGVQRVHNWRSRGIPSRVKVEFPELFMGVGASDVGESVKAAQPKQAV